ncbi:hypothetical protein ACIRBY_36480 [Streptomyces sp. NPDC096136]|uniref:hypothetical protein n=1 Tax=Streptomyces sp. NPDC096136 TaxID=3366076 RepID=UPI0037F69DEB
MDAMESMETITVPEGLQGYPGVAFGGYVAGLLAARVPGGGGGAVRVDFRRPVPTRTEVRLGPGEGGTGPGAVLLGADGVLLAAAVPAGVSGVPGAPGASGASGASGGEVPEAPSWAEAVKAADAYRADPPDGQVDCFGCGLGRTAATGLRLHCGVVPGRELVAAAWTPDAGLLDRHGALPAELVWGALDCPGNAAGRLLAGGPAGAVTAALTARVSGGVPGAGAGLVSYSWLVGVEGRKCVVGTALATVEGEVCAVAEALWVRPRDASGGHA